MMDPLNIQPHHQLNMTMWRTQLLFGRMTVELLRRPVLVIITGEVTMSVLTETPSGELSMLGTSIQRLTKSASLVWFGLSTHGTVKLSL
jgi:hypothetical protein